MDRKSGLRALVAFAIALVLAGLVLWPIEYSRLEMTSRAFLRVWIAMAVVAGIIGVILVRRVTRTTMLVTLGFGASFLLRLIREVSTDAGSHNLWPLALAIALLVGFGGGLAGALVGNWVRRLGGSGSRTT